MKEEIVTLDDLDTKDLVNEGNKNAKALCCQRCNCKILSPNTGTFETSLEKDLHVMHKKQEDAGIKKEKMKQFFMVNDIYDFDNIGVTKPVENDTLKYLICADCEVGPLGWYCISTKKSYVALARVKFV